MKMERHGSMKGPRRHTTIMIGARGVGMTGIWRLHVGSDPRTDDHTQRALNARATASTVEIEPGSLECVLRAGGDKSNGAHVPGQLKNCGICGWLRTRGTSTSPRPYRLPHPPRAHLSPFTSEIISVFFLSFTPHLCLPSICAPPYSVSTRRHLPGHSVVVTVATCAAIYIAFHYYGCLRRHLPGLHFAVSFAFMLPSATTFHF